MSFASIVWFAGAWRQGSSLVCNRQAMHTRTNIGNILFPCTYKKIRSGGSIALILLDCYLCQSWCSAWVACRLGQLPVSQSWRRWLWGAAAWGIPLPVAREYCYQAVLFSLVSTWTFFILKCAQLTLVLWWPMLQLLWWTPSWRRSSRSCWSPSGPSGGCLWWLSGLRPGPCCRGTGSASCSRWTGPPLEASSWWGWWAGCRCE